ncbi:MAG: TIGR00300 family protein [Planctomycetota bacterium]|nr:MAG: TIGR00300 family protein [Planctomycetota bacterium]
MTQDERLQPNAAGAPQQAEADTPSAASSAPGEADEHHCEEDVELSGHIIDSLVLPKVLDTILTLGGDFEFLDVRIGRTPTEPSYAKLRVRGRSRDHLQWILAQIGAHGAVPVAPTDCRLQPCERDGVFPDEFYATTNLHTDVRLGGEWIHVQRQEMDCAIRVDPEARTAVCVPMSDVKRGDLIVVGHDGIRVRPQRPSHRAEDAFHFMQSAVSSEKPKRVLVREIAGAMHRARSGHEKILVVGGPAIVHTGSRDHLCRLIREGYVQVLFAGNALAAHDIEQSMFGTSLGISLEHGGPIEEGHEHHLRAINRVRRAGSIAAAVEQGLIRDGIFYECIRHDVPFVLAGSIRDDGPLPDVITDVVEAQRAMRSLIDGVTFCLMIATTLHSIAVGNLLPAETKVVCVDINPATVTKLTDRGSIQTIGLVTDVEPFLNVLVQTLESLRREAATAS